MLSTIPALSFSEPGLVNQFSGYQTGFTPWDTFSIYQLSLEPAVPSHCDGESNTGLVITNSGYDDIKTKTGSDESCARFTKTKPGFNSLHGSPCSHVDEPDSEDPKKHTATANFDPGEQDHNRNNKPSQHEMTDEKKRKRKLSNRESARRSRIRRQSHIDNLHNQVNRLDQENRELGNWLRLVLNQLQQVNTDNNRLVTEQEILRLRLSEMRRILFIRQLQQQQQMGTS